MKIRKFSVFRFPFSVFLPTFASYFACTHCMRRHNSLIINFLTSDCIANFNCMENTKVSVENFDWAAFENESGLYDQSVEAIEKAYGDSMSNIAVGETVEGTVT